MQQSMSSIKRSISFLTAPNANELFQFNWINQKNVVVLRLIEVSLNLAIWSEIQNLIDQWYSLRSANTNADQLGKQKVPILI